MVKSIRRLLAVISVSFVVLSSTAQPAVQENKPYKLLTTAKQITIKSSKTIRHVMLWTTNGNRVIEQKEINNNSFILNIPVSQKTFYLMIGLSDGKVYTEKIGLRE